MQKAIPYGRQHIDDQDIQAVVDVLRSDWITQGPTIQKFEEAIAVYCGAKYAVAVSSGTAALHLACLVADLGKGDEAITTPMTFLATANAIAYTGARPVFADIQYDSVNIDPDQISRKINAKTKVILPVHFAGLPADLKEIRRLAQKKDIVIIEDACHAIGAEYRAGKIGSCQYSDMTTFSFHPVKNITTGEGGCITTNNRQMYQRLLALRHHGIYKTEKGQQKIGLWFHEMREMGFNYRMTDMQAALGISQLSKIGEFQKRRTEIAKRYHEAFSECAEVLMLPPSAMTDRKHAWHLYLIRLKKQTKTMNRRKLFDALYEEGIRPQVHYIPLYQQPVYRKMKGCRPSDYPNTEKYYREVMSLPMYPSLSKDDLEHVIKAVTSFVHKGSEICA